MENDLKWIKKNYGEKMMHMCREMFPKILEKQGALSEIMESHFAKNRHLADDIELEDKQEEFKNYIFSFYDVEKVPTQSELQESAIQLLKKAGYILYPECQSESDVQSFKKWWAKGEELCTFRGNRLNSCRVWFAVKDNAESIKREDFKTPSRQDEYGTSVISIQFTKSDIQTLSIKNRYNHTVNNPDNTFNSNLDNIIYGLTDAFERDYGVKDKANSDKTNFELTNYVCAKGKNYHYNYEVNGIYYCDNNIILDNFNEIKLPSHQMLIDTYIIDFKEKTINNYDKFFNKDCFPETIGEIENITFNGDMVKFSVKNGKDVEVRVDEKNRIISYKNENLIVCKDNFMSNNYLLTELELPNLTICGNNFLCKNTLLNNIDLPKLKSCGDFFLFYNEKLFELNLPSLEECGDSFLNYNSKITNLSLPKLKNCGDKFFYHNVDINNLNLQNLTKSGKYFLQSNLKLTKLDLPNLQEVGDGFLFANEMINEINLQNLKKCGYYFFANYQQNKELFLPNLEYAGGAFLYFNKSLKSISLPSLKYCGDGFLYYNEKLERVDFPNLQDCNSLFLYFNKSLKTLNLPNLKSAGSGFLVNNEVLETLNLPNIEYMGSDFLNRNKNISHSNIINKNKNSNSEINNELKEFDL